MSHLIPLICERCGGQIDRATYTCISCGTQYELDRTGGLVVFQCDRHTQVLGSKVLVSLEDLAHGDTGTILECAVKRLSTQVAEKLLPFMEADSELDPRHNALSVACRLRVVEPVGNVYDAIRNESNRLTRNGKMLKPRKDCDDISG